MKFIRDFSKFRELRINEALESGQFLAYHRTRLVEQSYIVNVEPDPNVNFYQQFAESMIFGLTKNTKEYQLAISNNIKLLSDMNPDIKLDDRGFPIVKIGDKITTQDPRIISQGFRAGAGDFYGVGLYTCYEFDDQIRDFDGDGKPDMRGYGQNIVEFRVDNTGKFLILDMTEGNNQAKKVWGANHTLIDQLKKIMGGKFLNFYNKNKELLNGFNEILVKTKVTTPGGFVEELEKDKKGRFLTGPIALRLCKMDGFISLVDGISFTGGNDGRVLVIYDADLAKPTRYTSDDGRTWNPMSKLEYQYERVRVGNKDILQCKIIDNDKELIQIDPNRPVQWIKSLDIPSILKDSEKTVKLFSRINISSIGSKKIFTELISDLSKSKPQVLDNIIKRLYDLPLTDRNLEKSEFINYLSNLIIFLLEFVKMSGQKSDLLKKKIEQICEYFSKNSEDISFPISVITSIYSEIEGGSESVEKFREVLKNNFLKSHELYSETSEYDGDVFVKMLNEMKILPKEVVDKKIDDSLDKLSKLLINTELTDSNPDFLGTTTNAKRFNLVDYKLSPFKRFTYLMTFSFDGLAQKYIDVFCKLLQKKLIVFHKGFNRLYDYRADKKASFSSLNLIECFKQTNPSRLNDESVDIIADAIILYLIAMKEEHIGRGSIKGQNFVIDIIKGNKIFDRIKEKLLKLKNGEKLEISGEQLRFGFGVVYSEFSKYVKLGEEFEPDLDYDYIADRIFKSMYGPSYKKDELFDKMSELRNDKDLQKVKLAFGKRKGMIGKEYDLDYWIKDELSKDDLQKLNNILKEKGINYQF